MRSAVHGSICISAGAHEARRQHGRLLPTPFHANTATTGVFHACLYFLAPAVGRYDMGTVHKRPYSTAVQLSFYGRPSVVHVPSD